MCICVVCVSRLRLMCRKHSAQLFTYKPLGVLKRSSVVRPTCGKRDVWYSDNAPSCLHCGWCTRLRVHWLTVFAHAIIRLGLRQRRRAVWKTRPGASQEEDGAGASSRKWSVHIYLKRKMLFVVGMFTCCLFLLFNVYYLIDCFFF